MKPIVFMIFCLIGINGFGQTDSAGEDLLEDSTNKPSVIETMPEFINGGTDGMLKLLSDSVKYPPLALKENVGGVVVVQFTVDTTGNVKDIKIAKGIREDIDNEARRIVGLLNGWRPGTQNERKVIVVYNLPIQFWPNPKFKRKYLKKVSDDK